MSGMRYVCALSVTLLSVVSACSVSSDGLSKAAPGPASGAKPGVSMVGGRPEVLQSCEPPAALKEAGTACDCNQECGSRSCVDGVCCTGSCNGTCQACNIPGKMGSCSSIPAGMAPVVASQCARDGVETCGFDGTCNGKGGCRKYPDGTTCANGMCDGATVKGAKICQQGTCDVGPDTVCAPFGCDASAGQCFDKCAVDNQCASSKRCEGGSCGKKNLGAKCGVGGECDSGFCADGTCCNTKCDGSCVSCNQALSKGECTPMLVDQPDPHKVCKDEGAGSCGQSGSCDGSGGCAKYGPSSTCRPGRCEGANLIPPSTCDGKGSCLTGNQVSCAPFACVGNACKATCSSNADCAGSECKDGSCGLRGKGQDCSSANQCASGSCVDGVCCDGSCTGLCKFCASSQARGTCINVAANTPDPRAAAGNTEGPVCLTDDPSTCGRNGMCNGNGACQLWPSNTMCEGQSCSTAQNTFYSAKMCDGQGACKAQDNGSRTCFPNKCNGSACGNACGSDNDCVAPNACVDGRCGPKSAGAVCSKDSECDSSFCRQGVCCQTDCKGSCFSCGLSGNKGSCTAVPAGEKDPAAICQADGAASCDRDGVCDGKGRCRRYAAGQVCASATCANGVATGISKCDGNGACVKGPVRQCDAYKCNTDGTACFESCSDNGQCVAGRVCEGSSCGAKPNGAECPNGPSECLSNFCSQGVCCNEACDGVCKSCKAGKAGTCENIPKGSPDTLARCAATVGSVCGNDGTCNGSGACAKGSTSVVCSSQSCPADSTTQTLSAKCDGAGNCVAGVKVECRIIKCDPNSNTCLSSCQSDSQCTTGNVCDGGTMSCGGLKPNGADCTANRQCLSAKCVEGVCCGGLAANESACPACQSCKIEGQRGSCKSSAAGAANAGSCPGGTGSCGAQTCNGTGACVPANPAGSSCGTPACVEGTKLQSQLCNTSGMCVAGAAVNCEEGFRCVSGSCKTSCTVATVTTDCVAGKLCVGNRCVSPIADGGSCTTNAQCANGACKNFICCNRACDGKCETCGTSGVCAVDAACLARCTSNADCQSSQICDPVTMTCVAKVVKTPRGGDCSTNSQCETGICSQRVCCEAACTGLCKTCAGSGADRGYCRNVPNKGAEPSNRCPRECSPNKKEVVQLLCGGDGECKAKGPSMECSGDAQCKDAVCVAKEKDKDKDKPKK